MKETLMDASILESLVKQDFSSGEIVRLHRERLELSQRELGEIADIQPNLISQYETGAKSIGKEVAEKLAVALEIRPESILYPLGKMKITPELKQIRSRSSLFFKARRGRMKSSRKIASKTAFA